MLYTTLINGCQYLRASMMNILTNDLEGQSSRSRLNCLLQLLLGVRISILHVLTEPGPYLLNRIELWRYRWQLLMSDAGSVEPILDRLCPMK